jgi:hypothetical protein
VALQKRQIALLYPCSDLFQGERSGGFSQQLAAGIGESAGAAARHPVAREYVLQILAYHSWTKNLSQTGDRILDQADSSCDGRVFRPQDLEFLLNPLHHALNILKRNAWNLSNR